MLTKEELPPCPVATTLMLIGNKWKIFIIQQPMDRPFRFSELRRAIPGISEKVLADRPACHGERRHHHAHRLPRSAAAHRIRLKRAGRHHRAPSSRAWPRGAPATSSLCANSNAPGASQSKSASAELSLTRAAFKRHSRKPHVLGFATATAGVPPLSDALSQDAPPRGFAQKRHGGIGAPVAQQHPHGGRLTTPRANGWRITISSTKKGSEAHAPDPFIFASFSLFAGWIAEQLRRVFHAAGNAHAERTVALAQQPQSRQSPACADNAA